jgi:hypothetical protein
MEDSTEGSILKNVETIINNNYFDETDSVILSKDEILKQNYLLLETNRELVEKNKILEKEKEKLERRTMELLKSLNELLKLGKDEGDLENLSDSIDDEIKAKITSIMYRELRMKHLLPFSPFISNFGNYKNTPKIPNVINKMH